MKKIQKLSLIIFILLTITGCFNKYEEGSYDKVDKKLHKYVLTKNYAQAQALIEFNPWYTVKDEELAKKLLSDFKVYMVERETFLPAIHRIDPTISPEIESKRNQLYLEKGLHGFNYGSEELEEYWARCTEGSIGHNCYLVTKKLLDHQPMEAGQIFGEMQPDSQTESKFNLYFANYFENEEISDLEDYMGRMYCAASIVGLKPAKSLNQLAMPEKEYSVNDDFHHNSEMTLDFITPRIIYTNMNMPENIRNTISTELRNKANGNKVLVLSKVQNCQSNITKLYVDGFTMRSLPAEYCPDDLSQVGYILLLDHGYQKDGIWFAGTTKATLYDVKTGMELYSSQTIEGQFDNYYVGPETDVIFGNYPNMTKYIQQALTTIH